MPQSQKTTNTHAINVVAACLTKLVIHVRTFFELTGTAPPEIIAELTEMETVIPTVLQLRRERYTKDELEAAEKAVDSRCQGTMQK